MVKSSLIDQLFLITWSYSTNSAQPLIWIQKPQFALLLNVTVSYISCLNWTSSFSYNTFKGRKRKGNLCYWQQLCYSIFHLLPGHLSKTTRWLHPWSLLCFLCCACSAAADLTTVCWAEHHTVYWEWCLLQKQRFPACGQRAELIDPAGLDGDCQSSPISGIGFAEGNQVNTEKKKKNMSHGSWAPVGAWPLHHVLGRHTETLNSEFSDM